MTELLAIDPHDCGCTECLIGEYRPLRDATDAEIHALFLGRLRDNTSEFWHISQKESWADGGFDIYATGRTFFVPSIAFPIPVEYYRLDATHEVIDQIHRGEDYIGASPSDPRWT